MTLFAPRDHSHVRSRLVRAALATTAAAACALGVATPSPALARDGGSIPDAFAQRRPAPHLDQRRDYATPDPTFRALTPAAGAAEDNSKSALTSRNRVAAKLTPAEIAQAQEMARKCEASQFKQCD